MGIQSTLDVHNMVDPIELQKILEINLDAILKEPSRSKIIPPLLIHGSPGLGKSTIVRDVCEKRGIQFIDCRLAQMEPCDIKGLPVPDQESKTMNWFVNGMWPRDPKSKGILFLDEITSADRSIQVAAYELILDRRLGSLYKVPDGWYIVAAGNNSTDRAVATTMSSALANRFMHVEMVDSAEKWLLWARANGIHPAVTGFIMFKPDYLFKMKDENLERGWPSPRSWERVSEICHIFDGSDEGILRKMVYGLVGNGAGVEFMTFYKTNNEFDNILTYMMDPKLKINVPKEQDRKYAMISAMIYLIWRGKTEAEEKKRIDGFLRICTELTSDFACTALIGAMDHPEKDVRQIHCKKILASASYQPWVKKHGTALQKNYKFL